MLNSNVRAEKQAAKLFLAMAAVSEFDFEFQYKVWDIAISKLEANGNNITAQHVRNLQQELAELWRKE